MTECLSFPSCWWSPPAYFWLLALQRHGWVHAGTGWLCRGKNSSSYYCVFATECKTSKHTAAQPCLRCARQKSHRRCWQDGRSQRGATGQCWNVATACTSDVSRAVSWALRGARVLCASVPCASDVAVWSTACLGDLPHFSALAVGSAIELHAVHCFVKAARRRALLQMEPCTATNE